MIGSAILAFAATPSVAQTTQEGEAASVEDIVVTGSRIRVRDTTGSSPIVTVTAEALEEIGTATVESYLNTLPQVIPHATRTQNNPSYGGSAFLNLRDLGPERGLVLVDGRRLVPGSSSGAVDVSILPPALIDRVEVITGGASAVYGADAVAGVVNFILKDDFEGLEMMGQYGISEEGDGEEYTLSLIAGGEFADGRGHITFSGSFNQRDSIGLADREFSRYAQYCDLNGCSLSGSPTTPDGTFSFTGANRTPESIAALQSYFTGRGLDVTADDLFDGQRIGFNPDGSMFIAGSDSSVIGYTGPTGDYDPEAGLYYNHAPVNLLQSPLDRYNFFTNFKYDVSDRVEVYGNALFSRYESLNALAESPATFGIDVAGAVTLDPNVQATLLGAGIENFALSRRTNELGPRSSDFTTNVYQLTGGIRGELPPIFGNEWSYDVFASYGAFEQLEELGGYPNRERINAALAGCPDGSPPGPVGSTGAPSVCVPFNPFGAGNITAEQRDYIESKGQTSRTDIEQTHILASVSGDLFDLWAGPVGFAAGLEYRDLAYRSMPPSDLQTGSMLGANSAAPVVGGYDTYEVFAELRVPLLADRPFVEYLGLEGGYRFSDYSLGFETETWKYGGEYAPTDWLRFRGLAQRAVRVPSVGELYATRSEGYPSVTTSNLDPCDADSRFRDPSNPDYEGNAGDVLALCQAQNGNITADWNGAAPGNQYRTFSGGNPDLEPEVADSLTLGLVFRAPGGSPAWFQPFTATVDYWEIEIENVISSIGFSTSLARCYDADYNPDFSDDNVFCQAINRDPATGYLTSISESGFISAAAANLASRKTSGVDLGLTYQMALADYGLSDAWGGLNFTLQATWYENAQSQAFPGEEWSDSWIGTIGDGTPGATATPEWRATGRVAWNFSDFQLSLRWQYIDEIATLADAPDIPTIDAYNYFYLNGSWAVNDHLELFGGVDNLFNEDPPIYSSGFQSNTDPSTYDVIGRYFYVGARTRF